MNREGDRGVAERREERERREGEGEGEERERGERRREGRAWQITKFTIPRCHDLQTGEAERNGGAEWAAGFWRLFMAGKARIAAGKAARRCKSSSFVGAKFQKSPQISGPHGTRVTRPRRRSCTMTASGHGTGTAGGHHSVQIREVGWRLARLWRSCSLFAARCANSPRCCRRRTRRAVATHKQTAATRRNNDDQPDRRWRAVRQ